MSSPARLADADARARIATDLETTLVVEAAAGTGKTTVLTERIARLIREGKAKAGEIVVLDGFEFRVMRADRRRIETLRVLPPAKSAPISRPRRARPGAAWSWSRKSSA